MTAMRSDSKQIRASGLCLLAALFLICSALPSEARIRSQLNTLRSSLNAEDAASMSPCGQQGSDCSQQGKLVPARGGSADFFGSAVAISGDVAAVGAIRDDDAMRDAGAVTIFRFDGSQWVEEQTLTSSDARRGDNFGNSVALQGNTLVVGARLHDANGNNAGAAYVFQHDGTSWVQSQKLSGADIRGQDEFGFSVDLDGDVIAVGSRLGRGSTSRSGAVYVFRFDGLAWGEEQKVALATSNSFDEFGYDVAVDGDRLLVGARLNDVLGGNAGAAHFFEFDGTSWNHAQSVAAPDAMLDDLFGSSVDLSGDLAVVGARQADAPGANSGAAYVFSHDGSSWSLDEKLSGSGAAFEYFGGSVGISSGSVAVGAEGSAAEIAGGGAVFLFHRVDSGWDQVAVMTANDASVNARLGGSIATDGTRVIGGAPLDRASGPFSGAAYVFSCGAGANEPPVALCRDLVFSASELCTSFVSAADLDDGSFDPDGGGALEEICVTSVNGDPVDCASSLELAGLGEFLLEVTVRDECGAEDTCSALVTVEDDMPPWVVSIAGSAECNWPPNHKAKLLTLGEEVMIEVTDNCDPDATITFAECISSEFEDGLGDGHTSPDCVVGDTEVLVRSERSGNGGGRSYTVIFDVADDSGNTGSGSFVVAIPHDNRDKGCHIQ